MVRPVLRPALAAAALLALGACANPQADSAAAARSLLVGMPKQTLLSCAGVPDRQTSVDTRDFFTYRSQRLVSTPDLSVGTGYWGPGWGWGMGAPLYGQDVRTYDCDATFTLHNGRVERLVYGGGGNLDQCYAIVRNCLAAIPPQPGVTRPPQAP